MQFPTQYHEGKQVETTPFCSSTDDIRLVGQANAIVRHIMREMQLHVNYCKSFGISEAEMRATEEKQGVF